MTNDTSTPTPDLPLEPWEIVIEDPAIAFDAGVFVALNNLIPAAQKADSIEAFRAYLQGALISISRTLQDRTIDLVKPSLPTLKGEAQVGVHRSGAEAPRLVVTPSMLSDEAEPPEPSVILRPN